MDKYEYRTILERHIKNVLPPYVVGTLLMEYDQLMSECIHWTKDDFVQGATDIEGDNWKNVYDVSKFQDTLELMIRKADAEIGVTWETVRTYLNEYCLKD